MKKRKIINKEREHGWRALVISAAKAVKDFIGLVAFGGSKFAHQLPEMRNRNKSKEYEKEFHFRHRNKLNKKKREVGISFSK